MAQGMLPTFIVVGSGKCGTTTLDAVLRRHPEVVMSKYKEPCFFTQDGSGQQAMGKPALTLEQYQRLFVQRPGAMMYGEVSPQYFGSPIAAEKIAERLPSVKIVVVLRNPVDRAYSLFGHLRRDGFEDNHDFSQALQASNYRWNYLDEALYGRNLESYMKRFPQQNILVCWYEDMLGSPGKFYSDLFDFLGISSQVDTSNVEARNPSGEVDNKAVKLLVRLVARPWLREVVRRIFSEGLIEATSRSYHRLLKRYVKKGKIPDEARRYLQAYFADDIKTLEHRTGRTLTSWQSER